MSKASRQSIALLATISGSMDVALTMPISDDVVIHRKFVDPFLKEAERLSLKAITEWECTGNRYKNKKDILESIRKWSDYLNEVDVPITHLILVYMSIQCLTDLHNKVKNSAKLALLDPIFEPLNKVSDYLDPEGVCWEEYDYVDKILLKKLYHIIGFEL